MTQKVLKIFFCQRCNQDLSDFEDYWIDLHDF